MEEKKVLRKQLLAKREEMSMEQINEISATIFEKIKNLDLYKEAKTIMVYVNYQKELNTSPFIQDMIADGKRVATPICNADRTMTLALTTKFPEGFVETKMHILEIPIEDAIVVDPQELDLIITPGVAFGLNGDRIGYGGGFYDRLFATMPERTKLLCPTFDDFIIEGIPMDVYDHKVDILISEKRSVFIGEDAKK